MMLKAASCWSLVLILVSYFLWHSSALIFRPVVVVVLPIKLTITSEVISGRPRQFIEITENMELFNK